MQFPINTQGRLQTPEDFEKIIIKRDSNGAITRLGDVARVEIDAEQYGMMSLLNNKQAVGAGIFSAPEANALEISRNVRATMEELKKNFPEDIDYAIVYDPTTFVKDSIEAVIHTLLEAILPSFSSSSSSSRHSAHRLSRCWRACIIIGTSRS
jgi:multidrug efflux pump